MKGLLAGLTIGVCATLAAGLVLVGGEDPQEREPEVGVRVPTADFSASQSAVPNAPAIEPGDADAVAPAERERVARTSDSADSSDAATSYARKRAEFIAALRAAGPAVDVFDLERSYELRALMRDVWRARGRHGDRDLDLPPDVLDILLSNRSLAEQ